MCTATNARVVKVFQSGVPAVQVRHLLLVVVAFRDGHVDVGVAPTSKQLKQVVDRAILPQFAQPVGASR